jgi:hypothetical protein
MATARKSNSAAKSGAAVQDRLELDADTLIERWKKKPLAEVNAYLEAAGIDPQPTIDHVIGLVKSSGQDWRNRRKAK